MRLAACGYQKNVTVRLMTIGALGMTAMCLLFYEMRGCSDPNPLNLQCHADKVDAQYTVDESIQEENCNGFYLVVFFPLLTTPVSGKSDKAREDLLFRREKEYIGTLVSNLNHPIVCKVYLLSPKPKDLQKALVEKYFITHSNLRIRKSDSNPHYADMFRFASDNLQDKVVAILNADIQLGEGFRAIGVNWWKQHPRTMHALTRHSPLTGCTLGPDSGYCGNSTPYPGSHDMFLFYLKEPLPEHFLKELCFPPIFLGSENVVMWAFREILKFDVTNPCLTLKVHHNHCVPYRGNAANRARVNLYGKTAMAPYTSRLQAGYFDFVFRWKSLIVY